MSTAARRTTLHDLPDEILESLLVEQPPSTLCAAAQSCRRLRALASSARVWRLAAARSLRADASSAAETRAAASRLTCAWWAAAGALVRGVPVHFRRCFVAVRARGGALVRVRSASDAAVFAMRDAPPHAPPPALEMDFAFAPAAPFPVDGMVARVVAAPVPSRAPRSPPASPPRSPRFSPPSTSPPAAARPPVDDLPHAPVRAVARVLLNGETLAVHAVEHSCRFAAFDVHIPAKMLRTKPGMNTLAVEYDAAASNAAYWLKTVRVVPSVLPMAPPEEIEPVPLRHVGVPSCAGGVPIPGAADLDSAMLGGKHGRFRPGRSPPHSRFAYSPFQHLNLGV